MKFQPTNNARVFQQNSLSLYARTGTISGPSQNSNSDPALSTTFLPLKGNVMADSSLTARDSTVKDRYPPEYQRDYRHKSRLRINAILSGSEPLPEKSKRKFFERFQNAENGCWIWTASIGDAGYGLMSIYGMPCVASRLSYLIHKGPIPDGLFVCHKCDNPPCVNPDHLFLGTVKDNADDAIRKGRYKEMPHAMGGAATRGSINGFAKLTEAKVADILVLAKQGRSHVSLASDFGVCNSTIGRIVHRKIWTHVEVPNEIPGD